MVENFAGLMSVIILELSSVVTSVIMQTYIVKYDLPTPMEIQSSVNSKSVLKTLKQNYSRPSDVLLQFIRCTSMVLVHSSLDSPYESSIQQCVSKPYGN